MLPAPQQRGGDIDMSHPGGCRSLVFSGLQACGDPRIQLVRAEQQGTGTGLPDGTGGRRRRSLTWWLRQSCVTGTSLFTNKYPDPEATMDLAVIPGPRTADGITI